MLTFAASFALVLFAPLLRAQSDFVVQSASPAFIGAGANGATLVLNGSLSGLSTSGLQVCFYNGIATSTPITPTVANGVTSIAVPASSIQSIPASAFTAANGYSVPGQIYVASQGSTTCDGTFDNTLTNSLTEPISEPLLGAYSGPTNIPQTNTVTTLQAPPATIVIPGSNFTTDTTVTLGSFGAATATLLSPSAISIQLPAALSSSAVGTTASVTVCNGTTYCSGAASTLTLTVTALVPSAGTLTITPTPTTPTGTTTLTAQFKRSTTDGTTLPEPGAPSGVVTFTANGNAAGTAPLVLDTTAVFAPVTTTTTIPATATPVITPPAGVYIGSQTITITDPAAGAAIFYTTDGTTPTTASTAYTGPFSISATGTVSAIALASGFRPSAVASNTYTIRLLPASKLAFLTQPSNTATGVTITPPIQVAIEDIDGNVITTGTSASAPVTISIAANPGEGTLAGTLTQNAVNGIATFPDLSILSIANGYTLTAASGNLTPSTSAAFNITPYPITVRLFAPLIGVTSTLPGTFTLSHPAPQGGVTVSLASSDTTLVSVSPATVTIAAGQTTGSFTYTGVQPTSTAPPANNNLGVATITASAPNYLAGTASVTETYSLVSLSTIPAVAPAQVIDLATSLATNAPAGGVTIFFTSSDPTVATITQSVFVPAGQRTAAANPQITGVKIGTTNIVATAQGYAPAYRAVNVTVTASFSPVNIQIPLATTNVPTLNITAPAQPGGLTFTLSSDDTTKLTVPASVTIPAGQTSVVVPVTGVSDSNGYIAVRANSPGVTEADLGVNVTSHISVGNADVGVNTQSTTYVSLPSTSPTPVTVTVTSTKPRRRAYLHKFRPPWEAHRSRSITSPAQSPTIFVQGQSAGTTTISASAPGYTATTGNNLGTVTVHLSGFTFNPYNSNPFNTTTFSSATKLQHRPRLCSMGNHAFANFATLSPGIAPVTVHGGRVSSPGVGTIHRLGPSSHAGDTQQYASFQPVSAGTTTLSLGTEPAGYTTPSNYQTSVANVSAPQLTVNSINGGVNMQSQVYVSLPVAPPNPVSVTLTSSNPAVASALAQHDDGGQRLDHSRQRHGKLLCLRAGQGQRKFHDDGDRKPGTPPPQGTNAGTAAITAGGFTINPYDGNHLQHDDLLQPEHRVPDRAGNPGCETTTLPHSRP